MSTLERQLEEPEASRDRRQLRQVWHSDFLSLKRLSERSEQI